MIMFVHNLDPVLAAIGPLQIRWYGLFFVIGFILAYFIMLRLVKEKKINWTKCDVEDLLTYGGVGGIIGARIFYILFYNLQSYAQDPLSIFYIWQGGLSFHGSLIGAVLGLYLFSKKHKKSFLQILDVMIIPFALALGIGRIGNFINGELVGHATNVPWCVDFGDGCRHPSQIYAALKDFFIFGVLWNIRNYKLKTGMLFTYFLFMYSILRFIVGFFRAPDPQIGFLGFLTLGQYLNIALLIVAIWLYRRIQNNIKH